MIEIFAIDRYGNREKIEDLYFFEEQGIHTLNGGEGYERYTFEVFVNGVKVWPVSSDKDEEK